MAEYRKLIVFTFAPPFSCIIKRKRRSDDGGVIQWGRAKKLDIKHGDFETNNEIYFKMSLMFMFALMIKNCNFNAF